MRLSLTLGAAVALALASASALATTQADIPPQPVAGPTPTGELGNNGGLVVAAWDGTRSIVQYLGINYLDVEKSDITTTGSGGVHLDFGTLSSFGSTFSDPSSVQYAVYAVDATKAGIVGGGISTTIADPTFAGIDPTVFFGDSYDVGINAISTYIKNVMNGALGCNGTNPCIAPNSASSIYAGDGGPLGSTLSNAFAAMGGVAASVGTAMEFFNFFNLDLDGNTQVTGYSEGSRVGHWLLSATGQLTWDFPGDGSTPTVPLPAAVWLLLSGLTGFGILGRRRRSNEVAAA